MCKYIVKPVTVEAFQMTRARGQNADTWPQWLRDGHVDKSQKDNESTTESGIFVWTSKGLRQVHWDEYIVRAADGSITICAPEEFLAGYEPIR